MIRTTLALLLHLSGCLVGSGQSATETRDVGPVATIDNGTFARVEVTVGAARDEIDVTCDDNLLGLLRTEVSGDTLTIRTDPLSTAVLPRTRCVIELAVADLFEIESHGSGGLYVDGDAISLDTLRHTGSGPIQIASIVTDTLDLHNSGSGGTTVDDLVADTLEAHSSGSGGLHLSGAVDVLDASLTGSGGMRERDLVARDAFLDVSGSGGVELTVFDHLDIRLSGSGGAIIHGDPAQQNVQSTGSGRVRFID